MAVDACRWPFGRFNITLTRRVAAPHSPASCVRDVMYYSRLIACANLFVRVVVLETHKQSLLTMCVRVCVYLHTLHIMLSVARISAIGSESEARPTKPSQTRVRCVDVRNIAGYC